MIKNYYLNLDTSKNPNGNYEVHTSQCYYCPTINKVYLGAYDNGIQAVAEAKRRGYYKADGCCYCCPEAHRE
ncbi:hypothetical protein DWZ56_16540 [Lachnotalea sp. AF33-28]|nr:hypothetical protein DWZ56_16540 [Lachnotalea sp. AF33-28]